MPQRRSPAAKPFALMSCALVSCALAALAAFAFLSPAAAQPAPADNKPDVTLGSTPDTVIWGYISSRVPPVLRIKSGTTVRIDTMSATPLAALPTCVASVWPAPRTVFAASSLA